MGTETAQQELGVRARSGARRGPLVYLRDRRLALTLLLALLAGVLAYQAPPASAIPIGWPGDRLFLRASQGLGDADAATFYGDEITGDARSGRSRWTRAEAEIDLDGLGGAGDLTLILRAQGWPAAALGGRGQPVVDVAANGAPIGHFTPSSSWDDYALTIPATVRPRDRLALTLHASATFTSADDPRPKGVRLEYLEVRGNDQAAFAPPSPQSLAWLVLDGAIGLLALVVLTRRPTLAFVLTTLLLGAAAIGLALARAWLAALLPWCTAALALLLLFARRAELRALLGRLLHRYGRGSALNYGLVTMAAAWLAYVVGRASVTWKLPGLNIIRDSFPDSLLYGLLGMGLLLLIVVRGRDGLPRLSNAIVRLFGSRRGAPLLLLLFATVWVGYEAYVVAGMAYAGHADYSDNAVVARNLAAGRGWMVDYVTQFYRIYNGVTRPQETWPLLQPVWIAPFFLLFGATTWAAKIPNLLFIVALALTIFAAGARVWDRRVGLTAAIVILTSYLFFRLVIYTTSDLAFTLFAFGAIYLLYRVTVPGPWSLVPGKRKETTGKGQRTKDDGRRALLGSGVLTGLMLLQKPASGALIALGMGLWFLGWALRSGQTQLMPRKSPDEPSRTRILNSQFSILNSLVRVAVWGLIALAILSPYLVRNMELFGTPFYSTESQDAWLIEYTDWDAIYSVYSLKLNPSRDELPNRSWVLRWGFDRTLLKVTNQVAAVRNYLLPPWTDQSVALGDSDSGKKALLFGMGAWLALLGALGALRSKRQLSTLLLSAFGPYTLFLVLYWHANEERYFVVLMPWLALLAAYALWRGYDRIAAIGDGRWTPVGLALAITAFVAVVQPSWPYIATKIQDEPRLYAADLDAYTWLGGHTAPDDVVMTRLPWQLNWASERPALMIPNTRDRATMLRLARYYNVRYLVRDTWQQPSDDALLTINQLIDEGTLEEIYHTPGYPAVVKGRPVDLVTRIYAFPRDYGGVAELQP